ncbi:MAG: SMP-30/gluconolactonase/LRE family protein [Thermomicrobiales bacterium]
MARNRRSAWLWALPSILVAILFISPAGSAGRAAAPPFTDLLPPSFVDPAAVVSDPAGNLWFAEEGAERIGRLAASGEITHFNLPERADIIERLVIGPDGALWFVARHFLGPGGDFVGRLSPDGQFATYRITAATGVLTDMLVGADGAFLVLTSDGAIFQLGLDGKSTLTYPLRYSRADVFALGPDGNLWIGTLGRIVRLTPDGQVTEFPLSNPQWEVYTLVAGPENALWFIPARILRNSRIVARITTAGAITEFPLSVPGLDQVGDIVAGQDGRLWVTLSGTNLLGRLSPDGTLATVELPPSLRATAAELGDTRGRIFSSNEHFARNADGSLWFTRGWRQPAQIGRIATDGAIAAYPLIQGFTPLALTIGPDRAIWFTEGADWFYTGATRIGRFPLDGSAAIVHDSALQPPLLEFHALTTGPDGNLWATAETITESFTDSRGMIVQLSPSGRIIESFPVEEPGDILTGPDGALWFTQGHKLSLGRITTDGQLSHVMLPARYSYPTAIAVGADGNLWVTGDAGFSGEIWRVTPAGTVTSFPLPDGIFLPQAIIAGPDGNLWFAADMTIGKITPGGQITTYRLPGYREPLYDYLTDEYVPGGLTVGADGNIWFTRPNNDFLPSKLGRITTSGVIDEYPFPAVGSAPGAIVSGPVGNLYIAAHGIRQLIRVNLGALTGTPLPSPVASPSVAPTITPRPPLPTPTATPYPIPGMPPTGGGGSGGDPAPSWPLAVFVALLLLALRWQPWRRGQG